MLDHCLSVTKEKMKSLYLILAATAVVVTSEPQRHTNNDIIWYPVDGEDGVFISTVGEKHRTPQEFKWRSHRRARYSGTGYPAPLPLAYDPTENHDPSFFHNINDRLPLESIQPIPKVPPAFLNQQHQSNSFQSQESQNPDDSNFQELLNEVFNYQQPSANELPSSANQWGNRPVSENQIQWGDGRPNFQNQWNNQNQRPGTNNQNQWGQQGQSPMTNNQNQWGNQNQRPVIENQSEWGNQNQRPNMGNQNQWGNQNQNQWGSSLQRPPTGSNQWGSSNIRPVDKPTNAEWLTPPASTNRPSKRPNNESDKLVFPGETSETTTNPSESLPTDPPTMSPCERTCPVTPEFNPVCGSDGVTYSNAGRLKCAQFCGKNVRLAHHGNCGRTPLVTPLLSNNQMRQFRLIF